MRRTRLQPQVYEDLVDHRPLQDGRDERDLAGATSSSTTAWRARLVQSDLAATMVQSNVFCTGRIITTRCSYW